MSEYTQIGETIYKGDDNNPEFASRAHSPYSASLFLAELRELEAERDDCKTSYDHLLAVVEQFGLSWDGTTLNDERLQALEAENARLREALENAEGYIIGDKASYVRYEDNRIDAIDVPIMEANNTQPTDSESAEPFNVFKALAESAEGGARYVVKRDDVVGMTDDDPKPWFYIYDERNPDYDLELWFTDKEEAKAKADKLNAQS